MTGKLLLVAALFGSIAAHHIYAQQLPEGDNGIAADYVGDKGITEDPAVIFADDFEGHSSRASLRRIWPSNYNMLRLADENAFLGKQCIEFGVPESRAMASEAAVILNEDRQRNVVFLRYYSRFDTSYDVMGSFLNGGTISGGYYGRLAGTDSSKFLVTLSHGRYPGVFAGANPGKLGIFIVHPGRRNKSGEFFFPTGKIAPTPSVEFGSGFVSREDIITELGRWHCHELMVKLNAPGKTDGRIAAWVDGKLAMDFPNVRLRDDQSLKIDHIKIGLSIDQTQHPETKKWYDNVVAATSYIGPVKK